MTRKRRDVIQRYIDAVYETDVAKYERANMQCFVRISAERVDHLVTTSWEWVEVRLETYRTYGGKKLYSSKSLSRRNLLDFEKTMGLDELAKREVETGVMDLMCAGAYPIGGNGPYPVSHPDEYRIRKDIDATRKEKKIPKCPDEFKQTLKEFSIMELVVMMNELRQLPEDIHYLKAASDELKTRGK